jgi:hypothetical protein
MARYGVAAAVGSDRTPFPTRQMAILGEWHSSIIVRAPAKNLSIMPDLRTHCLHVDIPLRILHGTIFHGWRDRRANLYVHGHGYIFVRIYGMLKWHFLGSTK